MSPLKQSTVANRLLRTMSAENFQILAPDLEALDMPCDLILFEPQQIISHVYFVESGIVSVVAQRRDGQLVEAGIYGRDGLGDVAIILATDRSSHRNFVQVAGSGFRIEAAALVLAMHGSPGLQRLLLHYAHVFMIQVSQTALSNGGDVISERLARWLLMCNDRIDGDIPITHKFLSIMLGVRRASVSDNIRMLESQELVSTRHGSITVRDRVGLERLAGVSYGLPEAEYRRLIDSAKPGDGNIEFS